MLGKDRPCRLTAYVCSALEANWPCKRLLSRLHCDCLHRPVRALCCRYMDGMRYASASSHCREPGGWRTSGAPGSCSAPFDKPFGLLLNVAVGGLLPGKAPGADTVFPQTMLVRSASRYGLSAWYLVSRQTWTMACV